MKTSILLLITIMSIPQIVKAEDIIEISDCKPYTLITTYDYYKSNPGFYRNYRLVYAYCSKGQVKSKTKVFNLGFFEDNDKEGSFLSERLKDRCIAYKDELSYRLVDLDKTKCNDKYSFKKP